MTSKRIFFFFGILCIGLSISAQDCNTFFPFKSSTKMEITQYDKKGKKSTVTQTTIGDVTKNDGRGEAEMTTTVSDKNGKELHVGEYIVTCKEDGYEVDVANMLNPGLLKGTYGMEVDITGEPLFFPNDLAVGNDLKDGSTEILVRSSGVKIMTITVDLTNRKVTGQESITTSAGTFDCYKIEYNADIKMGFMKMNYNEIQWIAQGVGVVKSEVYNKKGKLENSSELTKFEKP